MKWMNDPGGFNHGFQYPHPSRLSCIQGPEPAIALDVQGNRRYFCALGINPDTSMATAFGRWSAMIAGGWIQLGLLIRGDGCGGQQRLIFEMH